MAYTEVAAPSRTVPSGAKLILSEKMDGILDHLAKTNKLEWSAIGKVNKINDLTYEITDLVFPKQKNSAGRTEIDAGGLNEMWLEVDDKGESPEHYYAWIHSHNTMGVFWSGTDYAQMNIMGKNYVAPANDDSEGWGLDIAVCLVVNASGGRKASLNTYSPVETYYDMEVEVGGETSSFLDRYLTNRGLIADWNAFVDEDGAEQKGFNDEHQAALVAKEVKHQWPVHQPQNFQQQSLLQGGRADKTWHRDWDEIDLPGETKEERKVKEEVEAVVGRHRLKEGTALFRMSDDERDDFVSYAVGQITYYADLVDLESEVTALAEEYMQMSDCTR